MTIKNLKIDRFALETELESIAVASQECSEKLNEKILERDTAKLEADEYDASLDIDIRSNSQTKITEAQIKNLVVSNEERKKIQRDLIRLSREVNDLKALEENFKKKSSALKHMCELWCHAYYTDNSYKTSSSLSDEVQKEIRRNLKQKKSEE